MRSEPHYPEENPGLAVFARQPMSSLPEDGRFLLTFKEYPPSRVGGSLSIEKALAMVQNGASDGGKDPAQRRAGSEDFNG